MKQLRWWGPVVTWMVIIFIFSSQERLQISSQYVLNFLFFKTLHVLEYTILFLLNLRAVKHTYPSGSSVLWSVAAFTISLIYAISDEIHQNLVPTREGRLRDVIIDAVGAAFAWILTVSLLPKLPKKLQQLASRWQLI